MLDLVNKIIDNRWIFWDNLVIQGYSQLHLVDCKKMYFKHSIFNVRKLIEYTLLFNYPLYFKNSNKINKFRNVLIDSNGEYKIAQFI